MDIFKTISTVFIVCCFLTCSVPAQNRMSALRSAKSIFLDAKSNYMSAPAFERELLKLPEFDAWGLSLIRDQKQADLIVEIYRKRWTTRFTIAVLSPSDKAVLASCEETSLGGEIEPKLAKCLIKILRPAKAGYAAEQ